MSTCRQRAKMACSVSIHVLRRGRCVFAGNPMLFVLDVSIHVLRRGRCVSARYDTFDPASKFQSTSSEEDVVSRWKSLYDQCIEFQSTSSEEDVVSSDIKLKLHRRFNVSIHVLRRGRCVSIDSGSRASRVMFQSTSSEEDVVSAAVGSFAPCQTVSIHVLRRGRCVVAALFRNAPDYNVSIHVLRRGRCVLYSYVGSCNSQKFQSTSSEEDVVSIVCGTNRRDLVCFNPRPPKRTLCLYFY